MSVGALLALPAAKGTFHKAMNRSGAANMCASLEDAVDVSRDYLNVLGLTGTDVDGLRSLTSEQLLDAQNKVNDLLKEKENRPSPFLPVVDVTVMPEIPMIAIRNGYSRNISVMAGTSRDELKSGNSASPANRNLTDQDVIDKLTSSVDAPLATKLVKAYRKSLKTGGTTPTSGNIMGSINTDLLFRIPTIQLLEAQRDQGAKVFNYLFCYRSPAMGGILGAMHGLDNPFLFGSLDNDFTGDDPAQQKLAEQIQDSCAAFAHTGDPSCESAGEWPEYGDNRETMIWDTPNRIESAPFEDERKAWDGFEVK